MQVFKAVVGEELSAVDAVALVLESPANRAEVA